jgi:hypothetical protein
MWRRKTVLEETRAVSTDVESALFFVMPHF